ncbi:hypothetical protein ABK040_008936 [Willaertia magna]
MTETTSSETNSKRTTQAITDSVVIEIPMNDKGAENKSYVSKMTKTSKTSNLSTAVFFRINTCCGQLELSGIKVTSLIGMFVVTLAFCVLTGIIVATRILHVRNNMEILVDRGDMNTMRERLTRAAHLAAYSSTPQHYIDLYYNTSSVYLNTILKLQKDFPEGFSNGWLLKYTNMSLTKLEMDAIQKVKEGKKDEAIAILNSTLYSDIYDSYTKDINQVLDVALNKERVTASAITGCTLAGLVIVLIGLFFILPLMIGVFIFAINRDQIHLKKINNVNAILLMDTMNNDRLRELFKAQCEKEFSLENFKFLEKVTLYKRLCEQSYEIQEKLYGSDQSSDTTSSSHQGEHKKANNEIELKNIEKQKYEMAFDIYTDFLDLNGGNAVNISKTFIEEVKRQLDLFNTGKSDILPEVIFDNAAREVSIVMLDTHQRFKASQAFLKEMKVKKINVFKKND